MNYMQPASDAGVEIAAAQAVFAECMFRPLLDRPLEEVASFWTRVG